MVITVRYTKLQGGWEAEATSDLFTLRAQGKSQIAAKEGVLAYVLETLANEINEGQVALANIFPVTVNEIRHPGES